MTRHKAEKAGPREPHNIPVRVYGIGKSKEMDWHYLIEVNFDIQGGRAFIKGTNVPVRIVVGVLGAGDTMAEVCRRYRISRAAIRAAMSYAAEVLDREDVVEILGDEDLHRRICDVKGVAVD